VAKVTVIVKDLAVVTAFLQVFPTVLMSNKRTEAV